MLGYKFIRSLKGLLEVNIKKNTVRGEPNVRAGEEKDQKDLAV